MMNLSATSQEISLSQSNLIKDDPAYDEESPQDKWFNPSEGVDLDDKPVDELPPRLRKFRIYNYMEFNPKGFGRVVNLTMYASYILVAALVQAKNAVIEPIPHLDIVGTVFFAIWQVLNFLNGFYIFFSLRQNISWAGPYNTFLYVLLVGGTIAMCYFSFKNTPITIGAMQFEYGLLIVMAAAIFVDQRVMNPAYKKLYCYYHSAISKEEIKDGVRPIAGISNSALLKICANSGKALKFPDEAIETIQQNLGGQRIREGEKEALDDWTNTIYKLTHAVSLAPIFCVPKSKISASQCQQLTLQMILYLRVYMETGKIHEDEAKRTAPLTLMECLGIMVKLSSQVPFSFFIGVLPRSIMGMFMSAWLPSAIGDFTTAIYAKDRALGMRSLYAFSGLLVAGPLLSVLGIYVEALFTKKMVSKCRQKMLVNSMRGGTKFGEKFRTGKLIDSFSSQLFQFELYTNSFFITVLPSLLSTIAGVAIAARSYAPAVYLFISLMPIIFSVDYFEDRASRASAKRARTDAIFSGKVSSAVECRDAIRAGDASDFILKDMKEMLDATDRTHFSNFFRSGASAGYIQVMAGIYTVLVILPLGLGVFNGTMDVGQFFTVQTALSSIVAPINLFAIFSKLTSQNSGSIKTVWELMDDSLTEQPSSKSSSTISTIKKLSSSLSIKDIKFRYGPTLPDVIKGVNISLSPGTYAVICGESGSGKSTVLSLLMRFQTPYEGTIEWDGTNIFGSSLESFRENVGVMFQKTMIYQGTIRDNILFGQPEQPGAVEDAARAAEIAEVIERLPEKYDTVIGGDALAGMSGGQLQRVCMARALYRKPSVLLLDEATSALDAETEHSIIETLVRLRDTEGLTLVSVSHHPSTAVKADKIVVLEKGVIAEEGTYDELVSRKGSIFKRMVEAGEEVLE